MDRSRLIAVAAELFHLHGLTARGWRLTFRNYAHRLGSCCSRKRIISLNDFYAERNGETPVLDTLLHEIAHALVGPSLGHGAVWKAMARKLGCIPKACGKTGLTLRPGSYQATCPTCAHLFNKYRRPKPVRYYCPACGKERGQLVFARQIVNEVRRI
jgi:predicted SprT family Zn-dependent metalloprotease